MTTRGDQAAIRFVTREARRAWDHVAPELRRSEQLDARSALAVVFMCQVWAQYRLLLDARRRWPADRAIPPALERARMRAREIAADFALIPPRRVRVAALDRAGEDLELRRIFGGSAA